MSLIMGVDPSLDRTGYAILRGPRQEIVEAGVIRTSPRAGLPARLKEIYEALAQLFDEYDITRMAVEDLYAHYKHPRTAILMGHARGVIVLAATCRNVPVESYSATRVKKSMTGNGHASKLQMQRAVAAMFGLRHLPEPADVADAIAIARCAMANATP